MIDEKISALNTPCYVYDTRILKSRIAKVREVFGNKYQLCYSMKANPYLLKYIFDLVDRIEVCSHGEFNLCKEYELSSDKIIYTGVNKQMREVEEAVDYGVRLYNIESLAQLDILMTVANKRNVSIELIIRFSSGNQFGMNIQDCKTAINTARGCEYVEVKGFHFFSGTMIPNKKRNRQLYQFIDSISGLREELNEDKICIEYGPGLPVRYFVDEECDVQETAIDDLKEQLDKLSDLNSEDWTVEMGRFLVADCGSYLTKVVDLKTINNTDFAIVDGGINHLNYFGQNMALRVPEIKYDDNGRALRKYWICGSLCTTADVLVKDAELAELGLGDLLLFENCGAYSNTEANYLFLSRDLPYIYLIGETGEVVMIRNNKPTYTINKENK